MANSDLFQQIEEFAKAQYAGDSSGHDWWHAYRVSQTAKKIAQEEKVDIFIVEAAALLHDVADFKFNESEEEGLIKVANFLQSIGIAEEKISAIIDAIKTVSFKGASVENVPATLEGKIVQDADRLDALGAIGIARTMAFGGSNKRSIYEPDQNPADYKSFDEYKNNKSTSINHFYEKLLLLKDRMNTTTAKKVAAKRHHFCLIRKPRTESTSAGMNDTALTKAVTLW